MALTGPIQRKSTKGGTTTLPVADGVQVFEGAALGLSSGYVRPLVSGDRFAGFAVSDAQVGNGGGRVVNVARNGEIELDVSGVDGLASVSQKVYASDDGAFSLSGASCIGEVSKYVSPGRAMVAYDVSSKDLYTTQVPRIHESPFIQQDGLGAFYNLTVPFTSGGATITGGGASGARAARVYTCSAGSQRAFDTITRTVKGGQWYAFAVQVDAISGTLAQNVVALQTTPTIGASSITHTEVNAGGAGKTYALRFMFDNDTSLAIRIGLGTAINEGGALGLTLDYPMLCTIDGPTGIPPEHPLGMGTVVYDYENPNYYNPATKILTRWTAGTRYPIQRGHSIVCIADSFGTEPAEFAGVLRDQHRREVHVMAVAGATLTNFATYLDTWITNKPAFGNTSVGWTEGYQGLFAGGVSPSVAVFCSGINDIVQGATLAQMQSRVSALAATCVANGLVPVFTTTAPFGNFVSWTSGLQSVADAYNAWLLSSASGVVAVDIYSPLEDPANPDDLPAIYDSGDGLHPNTTAHSVVIAPAIDRVLRLIGRYA